MGINLGQTSMTAVYFGQTAVKSVFIGSNQVWGGEEPMPTVNALCFTAEEANSTVRLDKVGSPNAVSLETSTDGSTWTDYSWTDSTGDTLTLANVGDKVYMRAKEENQTIGSSSSNYYKFVMTGLIAASGNIQTLLKADGSRTDAPSNCYRSIFQNCTSLTTAPALPATTIASNCCRNMFNGCSSLTSAPATLPAITIDQGSYISMFTGCTSLTTAPELPATTLASNCYSSMFNGCTSLTTAPALPATTLASNCYNNMFTGCTSLTAAPALPATTLASSCYNQMFYGCASLSSIEVAFATWTNGATNSWLQNVAASGTFTCPAELPDIRDASHIPSGWTVVNPVVAEPLCFTAEQANSTVHLDKVGSPNAVSLETSTDGSTWTDYSWTDSTGDTLTLVNIGDKVYMRAKTENQTIGSSSSNYYKFIMTGQIAASGNIQTLLKSDGSRADAPTYCYYRMFYSCEPLTSAPALPATTLADYCYDHMFYNCSYLASAPALPATTLADYCYNSMFTSCIFLTTAPAILPAETLAKSCYSNMFFNCTSLASAPELPATTLTNNCYNSMFRNCSSLTTAPELPATTLISQCYSNLFRGCSSLSSVKVAFTTWTSGPTDNWLNGVAASGTFTCPAELPDTRGASNIPSGWTKVDAA